MSEDKLKLISSKSFSNNYKAYEIVDFLNKSLKDKNIIFGLKENNNTGDLSIYIYEI